MCQEGEAQPGAPTRRVSGGAHLGQQAFVVAR
jgi:hypothetical protein